MSPQIHAHPGKLPPFWDRKAIFFANLLSLFYGNKGETGELIEQVGGLSTYGGRLLPILDILFAGKENLLVLECETQEALVEYFRHTLGLHLPTCVKLSENAYPGLYDKSYVPQGSDKAAIEKIIHHQAGWVDGFVIDEQLKCVADKLDRKTVSSLEGSRKGNNKYLLHAYLEGTGYPIFDTELAESPGDVPACLESLAKRGYKKAVVKSQVGASGIGLMRLSLQQGDPPPIPPHMFYEGACLVQGWLDDSVDGVQMIGSPSVQMFLADQAIYLYDVTDQVLSSDSIHEGNVAPPPSLGDLAETHEELLRQTAHAAHWLHDQGYRGTASTDFLVVQRHDEIEVRICEINARVTGATYPSILARYFFPGGAWLMRNVRFEKATTAVDVMQPLATQGLLYAPGNTEGVLPINFNQHDANRVDKGQFLFLGETLEGCQALLQKIEGLLPVAWRYDRD